MNGWIRTLSSGRYQACRRDGAKRVQTRTFDRRKDAAAWLAKQAVDTAAGAWTDPRLGQRTTLRDYTARWQVSRDVERSTEASDRGRIDNHILTTFGDWPIGEIRYLDVAAWVKDLRRGKGLAPKTVRECLALLKMILDAAVVEGVIPASPAASVKPPAKVAPTHRELTRGEVDAVLEKARGGLRARIALGAFAAPRWGEVCGLRWGSVNLAAGTIAITETMEEIDGRFYRKRYPKDREGRTVPIVDELAEILLDHAAARLVDGRPGDDDLVFPSRAGTPLYRSNNGRSIDRVCRAAKVEPFDFKDLRRFCASYLINDRGVPVTVVRELLGHSKASMTLEVYTAAPTGWHDAVREAFARL